MIYNVLNKVTTLATNNDFEAEVKDAKETYFGRTGPVNEDDQTFETRMALFLEWYLFDRPFETI